MEPRYPHLKPEDGSWRKSTLFSIAGWMSSWYGWSADEVGTAFGGYFRLDEETGHISGEIVDTWGAAKIEGELKGDVLSFKKKYLYRAHPSTASGDIDYQFTTSRAQGWHGTLQGKFVLASGTEGEAECKITSVVDNAFALVIGPVVRS